MCPTSRPCGGRSVALKVPGNILAECLRVMKPQLPETWSRLREQQSRSRRADRHMRVRVRHKSAAPAPVDPVESAELAGLKYVNDFTVKGIRRIGSKKRVGYVGPN